MMTTDSFPNLLPYFLSILGIFALVRGILRIRLKPIIISAKVSRIIHILLIAPLIVDFLLIPFEDLSNTVSLFQETYLFLVIFLLPFVAIIIFYIFVAIPDHTLYNIQMEMLEKSVIDTLSHLGYPYHLEDGKKGIWSKFNHRNNDVKILYIEPNIRIQLTSTHGMQTSFIRLKSKKKLPEVTSFNDECIKRLKSLTLKEKPTGAYFDFYMAGMLIIGLIFLSVVFK